MSAEDIPALFADEELLRLHFPSLDNGELQNLSYNETAAVLEYMELEAQMAKCRIDDIVEYLKDGLEERTDPGPECQADESGQLPSIHTIFGSTNTVASENRGEDLGRVEEKEEKIVTTWEKIFGSGPNKTGPPGRLPSIQGILGSTNTSATEHSGEDFVRDETEGETASEKKRQKKAAKEKKALKRKEEAPGPETEPKKTRFVNRTSKWSPVTYEYLAGLALQNGVELVPEFYQFVLVHAPVIARVSTKGEAWKTSLRQTLMRSPQFFTRNLSLPLHKGHGSYSMTPDQLIRFREKYPFHYGFPEEWLLDPANFEAIYYGKMGFPSREEVKQAQEFYKKKMERPITPAEGKTMDKIMKILNQTHSSDEHLAKVPSAAAASSVEERLFSSATPSDVNFAVNFGGTRKTAPSSLPPIHSNSSIPFEQTLYGGLLNLDSMPPKQVSSMDNKVEGMSTVIAHQKIPHNAYNEIDNGTLDSMPPQQLSSTDKDCTETRTSSLPVTTPFDAYNEIPKENCHPMVESNTSIVPKQVPQCAYSDIPRDNFYQMRGVDTAIAPKQTERENCPSFSRSSSFPPPPQRTIVSRVKERLPDGRTVIRTIYFKPTADAPQPTVQESSTAMAGITRGSYETMNACRVFANEHVNLWKAHPEPFTETTNAPVPVKRRITEEEVYKELQRKRLRAGVEQNELDTPLATEKEVSSANSTNGRNTATSGSG